MLLANSRQTQGSFLTPLPPEFQKELGQSFFSSRTGTHTETGSSDRELQLLEPLVKQGLAQTRISEIRKALVTSDHFMGCDLCNTISFETKRKRLESMVGKINGNILYSLFYL